MNLKPLFDTIENLSFTEVFLFFFIIITVLLCLKSNLDKLDKGFEETKNNLEKINLEIEQLKHIKNDEIFKK